jgi:uncharacterized membrane protein (UPF0136 family)
MIILGMDTSKVNWYLVAYVLLSILFLIHTTSKLYPMGQTRGVIYAIGTFFVLIYFGFIWFKPTKSKLNTWPPVINMCPDYLTYYKPTGGTGVCLDMLGVSKNGGLGTVVTNVAAATPTNTFIYTSNDVKNNTNNINTICNYCAEKGVTWEGVYDGDTCIGAASSSALNNAVEQCLLSI